MEAVWYFVLGTTVILQAVVIAWSWDSFHRLKESRDAYRASYLMAARQLDAIARGDQ